jgi:hypothetical protein
MNIIVKLDPEQIYDMLRDDIAENLGIAGVYAIVDELENAYGEDETIEFDQALFSEWYRYDNAIEACHDLSLFVDILQEEGADSSDVEDECLAELQRNYNIIMLDDHSVIVQNI